MSARFFVCDHCGNLITTLHDAGVPMLCCGEKLRELIPNTVEASGEKHLPVVEHSGNTLTVTVGAVEHPMVDVTISSGSMWKRRRAATSVISIRARHPERFLSWATRHRWRSMPTAICMACG